jgi:phosphopantetheinyl transferase
VLAHLCLHPRERHTWRELHQRGKARRRAEWLLGRVALKDAVRLVLGMGRDPVAPADLIVRTDPRGRPSVCAAERPDLADRVSRMRVSLAHTGGAALAVATEADNLMGIGVDAEPLRTGDESYPDSEPHAAMDEVSFTSEEREWIGRASGAAQREESRLRLWCAKEAYAKATGAGLVTYGGPKGLTTQHDRDDCVVRVRPAAGADLKAAPVRIARRGDLVLALAVLARTAPADATGPAGALETACPPVRPGRGAAPG